jgi:hypothetical protein
LRHEQAGQLRSRVVRKHRVEFGSGRRYVACFVFDVTELKRREREAEEARKRLADVLESLPAGVVIYDREDRFVLANRKLKDTLPGLEGISARAAIPRSTASTRPTPMSGSKPIWLGTSLPTAFSSAAILMAAGTR